MSTLNKLLRERATLDVEQSMLEGKILQAKRRQFIKCDYCGKQNKIGNTILIQTHWYTEPYSCTAGDYWSKGECLFECNKCGGITRMYQDNRKKFVEENRYAFKKINDIYDR